MFAAIAVEDVPQRLEIAVQVGHDVRVVLDDQHAHELLHVSSLTAASAQVVGSDRDRNFFVDDLAANETDSTKGRVREALRKPALAGVIYLGTRVASRRNVTRQVVVVPGAFLNLQWSKAVGMWSRAAAVKG